MTDLRQFRTLARNWEAFAQADPLFGVLSDPTKFGSKWDLDEFFKSGSAHIDKWLRILAEHDATFARGACLDFGCGVGRLTIPLAQHFERTVGIDVSSSMIATARKYARLTDRVAFVRNPHPDLRQLHDATFDMVHSCLVLQHIPPPVTLHYIAEFLRVTKPGGLVMFQLPAATISEEALTTRYTLPDDGFNAGLSLSAVPPQLEAESSATVVVTVTNRSAATWRHDIPAGRHLCIANHWLRADGSVWVADDGRARLPETLEPGASVEVPLTVRAPSAAGEAVLDVDLVQERVCWFAQRGSQTARAAIRVLPSTAPQRTPAAPAPTPRPGVLERIRRRFRRGTPTFEMHIVARRDVERVIAESGGVLLHAIDDNAAGDRWLSYTYICRKT